MKPFSVRLEDSLTRYLEREHRLTGVPKGSLLQDLATEAMRCRRFPGIAFKGSPRHRRPFLLGAGVDLWQVVAARGHYDTVEEMATSTGLGEDKIQIALAYCAQYSEEIDREIRENEPSAEEFLDRYPTFSVDQPRTG